MKEQRKEELVGALKEMCARNKEREAIEGNVESPNNDKKEELYPTDEEMEELMQKPKPKKKFISVFITKTGKFRARIIELDKSIYEVTINGKNWKAGIGHEHEEEIREKIFRILTKLEKEFLIMKED